ncbi:Rhodanese-like domain-containing protein, partial [Mycena epipterygia]
ELAKIISDKNKVPNKDYLVVDVRDDDYPGGHIKGALNLPSQKFKVPDAQEVKDLVQDTADVPIMVFHCALSQARGPKAARIYHETRNDLIKTKQLKVAQPEVQKVWVLRNGFDEFGPRFKDNLNLVENWDKEVRAWS